MGWQDKLESPYPLTMAWLGGRKVHHRNRVWKVQGRLPRSIGWYEFEARGRSARLLGESCINPTSMLGWNKCVGHLVGNRLIPLHAKVVADPNRLTEQTVEVFLADEGIDRFQVVEVQIDPDGRHIFVEELFIFSGEDAVRQAFADREESLDHIKDVTPELDLAFRFASQQRIRLEERRAEMERVREEERRREELLQRVGTGAGRRVLATDDFEAAARAALAVSGAELLDTRGGRVRGEVIVQYRLENRRFECVADRRTLRIIDSGICLTSESTGERGDGYFTLESLPSVVSQAIREHVLVVYRHVD